MQLPPLQHRQQRVVVNGIKSNWAPVGSGVPQGTILGPLLFSLYINDISVDTESEMRLFADECVCYREIKNEKDTLKLQRDIDGLGSWARTKIVTKIFGKKKNHLICWVFFNFNSDSMYYQK